MIKAQLIIDMLKLDSRFHVNDPSLCKATEGRQIKRVGWNPTLQLETIYTGVGYKGMIRPFRKKLAWPPGRSDGWPKWVGGIKGE